jgi:MFS family permease
VSIFPSPPTISHLPVSLTAGYNISVMNAPEQFVFPGHSTEAWSVAVAAFCVGGPFGAVLAGKWADQRGRRGALLLTTWLFIVGGVLQATAPSLLVVMVARTVIGVSSGASTVLVPIYLGECKFDLSLIPFQLAVFCNPTYLPPFNSGPS